MAEEVYTSDKIRLLSYRDLQKLAIEHGLKGNARKLDLITSLIRILVRDPGSANESQASGEQMEMDTSNARPNDTFLIEGNSLANSTYVVDADNVSEKKDELYLTADEPILAGSGNVTTDKENTLRAEEPPINSVLAKSEPSLSGLSRPSRVQLVRTNVNSKDRFAERHKREFAKMVSIDDAQKKLDEKHKQREKSSEHLKRLATPKNVAESARQRFRTPSLPNQAKFKFGSVPAENIEAVQKPILPLKERPEKSTRRVAVHTKAVDVKAMTMKQPIVPQSRIEQLATPKSNQAPSIASERRSYTPNKSPYRYVDTTKMSDSEFRAYRRQQNQDKNRLDKMVI